MLPLVHSFSPLSSLHMGRSVGSPLAAGTHTIRTNKQKINDNNKNDEKSSCKDPIKWRERGENLPTCLCIQSWGSIFGSRTRERFSHQSAGAGRPLPLRERAQTDMGRKHLAQKHKGRKAQLCSFLLLPAKLQKTFFFKCAKKNPAKL